MTSLIFSPSSTGVTTNLTSSIFSRVGGAAKSLAAAASTTTTPTTAAVLSAAAQPEMYWDAQRGAWMTGQVDSSGAVAAPQGEMVSLFFSNVILPSVRGHRS